jgi:hypothetical protein
MDSKTFERLLSYHSLGQPCLRDMVFDYYCGVLKDTDKAGASTKLYTDNLFEKFVKKETWEP